MRSLFNHAKIGKKKKKAVTYCATESFSLIILYDLYAATSRVARFSGLIVPNSIMDS